MKKIITIMTAMILLATVTPVLAGDEDITGTFTPSSSGISIACNETSPAFGSISLNSEGELKNFNVTNEGDTNCSVAMTAEDGAGTWTLVAGTDSPATTNEYCVNVAVPSGGGYSDAQSEQSISSDLPPAGATGNYTSFDLKVHASKYTNEGTPGEQTFYTNLTASALS